MVKKTKKATSSDDNLHAKMLEQLGLKTDTKEGQQMLGVLKKKLTNDNNDDDDGW